MLNKSYLNNPNIIILNKNNFIYKNSNLSLLNYCVIFDKKNLLSLNESEMRHVRGKNITAIFQEPMTSLNPLHTVEKQINEILSNMDTSNWFRQCKKLRELEISKKDLLDVEKRVTKMMEQFIRVAEKEIK